MKFLSLPHRRIRAAANSRAIYLISLLLISGSLWASGWPPFASRDSATVKRGGIVTVLDGGAESVLDNDFDFERDPLQAFLTEEPEHGELILRRDGTFEYRHDGDSNKSDEFEYRAFDGTSFSRDTEVKIRIAKGDPIPPVIVGQREVRVDEDSSRELKPADLQVEDPDSNFPKDFAIEVSGGDNYSRNGTIISPVANFNGELSIPVRVHDGTDFSNQFLMSVEVRPRNDAPFVVGVPPDQEAIEGTLFTLALASYFGDIDDGDTLRFSVSGLPGNGISINANSGVLSGIPRRGDARETPYMATIVATDSGNATAQLNFRMTIFPDDRADLAVTATVVVNPVVVGESTQWQIDVLNQGPADLEEGTLAISWSTSGAALTISTPSYCSVQNNGSSGPSAICDISGIVANNTMGLSIQGTQVADGDNTLIAVAIADDPKPNDNSAIAGSQVVEEFSEGPTQILDLQGADIDYGDIDGDGTMDIVAAADDLVVFLNGGNRELILPGQVVATGIGGGLVVLLDWNGDTALDIAVGGVATQVAEIFINDGSGEFTSVQKISSDSMGTARAIAAADLDQDGSAELIITGSRGTMIVKRQSETSYSVVLPPVGAGIDVAVGDINNDGAVDIAVVESADRAVAVMINTGNGSKFNRTRERYGSVGNVTVADVNDDGLADLLLAIDGDDLAPPGNRIAYRQPGGGFSAGESFGASAVSELLAGDVDGDGRVDIVAINEAGVHQLYYGTAGGQLDLFEEQIVSFGMQNGVLVDFNDDQSFDLIMGGTDVVEIHANNGIGRLGLGDRQAPIISLLGEASINIAAGSTYEDAGATANDDIDGNLDGAISKDGTVNPSVVGTYRITYSVADRAGNESSKLRTVVVGVNDGVGGGGGGAVGPLLLLLIAAIGVTFGARTVVAQSLGPLEELKACARTTDRESRIACYEELGERVVAEESSAAADKPVEAVKTSPVAQAAPAATAATVSVAAVESTPQLSSDLGGAEFEEKPQTVESDEQGLITACNKGPDGRFYFHFDNGQIWQQKDSRRLSLKGDCRVQGTMIKDAFGYKLKIEGVSGKIRVARRR